MCLQCIAFAAIAHLELLRKEILCWALSSFISIFVRRGERSEEKVKKKTELVRLTSRLNSAHSRGKCKEKKPRTFERNP